MEKLLRTWWKVNFARADSRSIKFLQHHELGLDFHVEAACRLKQPHQDAAERNVFERPRKNRFAHGANGGFEFIDARLCGHPARFDVHFSDAPIVAPEKSEEVVRQIMFVDRRQRAHDAEVERDVLAVGGDEYVARMHVGMKKTVAEDLGEKYFDARARELLQIDEIGRAHV